MSYYSIKALTWGCLLALAVAFLPLHAAQAAKPKPLIKNPAAWGAFSLKEAKGLACYLAAQPDLSLPKSARRGDIWFMVTHRPKLQINHDVSIMLGYPLKKGKLVTIVVDKKRKFRLMSDGDTAWTREKKDNIQLVRALSRGSSMVVSGVSSRGTKTTDKYSLKGFTAAHRAINKACKIK